MLNQSLVGMMAAPSLQLSTSSEMEIEVGKTTQRDTITLEGKDLNPESWNILTKDGNGLE